MATTANLENDQAFGWPGIKPSYVMFRVYGVIFYRGALRRSADKGVIWECEHEHTGRGYNDDDGALRCATREHWRRSKPAAPAPRGEGEGQG